MIVGQVVDAASGDPVGEAIVTLTMPKYVENPATPKGRVMTDREGRFFFTDLPAGEYFLQATKDGYAPGTYGERRAWACLRNYSFASVVNTHHENLRSNRCSPVVDGSSPCADHQPDRQMDRNADADGT